MKTPEEILNKHLSDNSLIMSEDLFKISINAMLEYTEVHKEIIIDIFLKPKKVFEPLEKIYVQENPIPKYGINYAPDTTKFYKWIVKNFRK